MSSDEAGTSARTNRLGDILGAYFVAVEEGRGIGRQELLEQHPDLASELADYFAEQDRLDHLVAPLRSTGGTGSTVIDDLAASTGSFPRVLLRDTEPVDRSGKPLGQSSPEIPKLADRPAWLQLFGEIARGGMGAILRGRDVDLVRELAVKVLLESNQGHPEVVRRFIEEAQIGGQLQHPGIVPVYELGAFADRRPYFAMKLVEGQTLASLLAQRSALPFLLPPGEGARRADEGPSPQPSPGGRGGQSDLPRFLSIFEQVCQTMAYSHAYGVIHRDLKPSNVMVGAFGEVQVMDWGLARVLRPGDAADEVEPEHETESAILTVRSGSSDAASLTGIVLGTPSYMALEQARGELDQVDERAHVFGLGAILCEILTGQPPFVGQTREEIRDKAARGDLTDAFRRLDTCEADPELLTLARDCLAPDRQQRPRDAMQVAARMTAYIVRSSGSPEGRRTGASGSPGVRRRRAETAAADGGSGSFSARHGRCRRRELDLFVAAADREAAGHDQGCHRCIGRGGTVPRPGPIGPGRRPDQVVRLSRAFAGTLKPIDAAEMQGFAQFCYSKKLHGVSAQFWAAALRAQPKLADDMQSRHRYNAACAAALGGCGQDKDDPPLDEPAKTHWRKQALDWLKADLAYWSKQVEAGTPQARQVVAQTPQHWKSDIDLAGIRDEAALAKLPAAERESCRALWRDVDRLANRAAGKHGAG